MPTPEPPSFDLVVATVERTDELERLLVSLEPQAPPLRLLVVDQNDDDRAARVLAAHPTIESMRLRLSPPGLARARNAALPHLSADVVAFPDDDCAYPDALLEEVARRLAADPALDGLSGRTAARDGRTSGSWEPDPAILTADNLWNRLNSAALFLRRGIVERVGAFDEALGLGSGTPSASGEEVDYAIRAVRAGARILYDPGLVVLHEPPADNAAVGYRDGAAVGYVLAKHGYPLRTRARMLVRPAGGALLSLARLDGDRARYHAATVHGRVRGYRRARSSKSSA